MRHYSFIDHCLTQLDGLLTTCFGVPESARAVPKAEENLVELTEAEKELSIQLLRVNHTGEVCAQALYEGQACTSNSSQTRDVLLQAAKEEQDHLAWCAKRLAELGGRPSYLNPIWYGGAWALGSLLGCLDEQYNLGFVEATEHQVERHLKDHLSQLPNADMHSQVILKTMMEDEIRHGQQAIQQGGQSLPAWVESLMYWAAQPMRFLSRYL